MTTSHRLNKLLALPGGAWRQRSLRDGFIIGLIIAPLVLAVWWGQLFQRPELTLQNFLYLPQPVSDNIVIVALDDASLNRFGRSITQWSRTIYAELVERMNDAGARVVAFDVIFSESATGDDAFASAITRARESDNRMPVVLAAAGLNAAYAAVSFPDYPRGLRFHQELLPTSRLYESAERIGYTNAIPDMDNMIRRFPSVIQTAHDELGLSFSVATYLAYLHLPPAADRQIVRDNGDRLDVTPYRRLRVDERGFWRHLYFGPPSSPVAPTFPLVSLVQITDGNVPPETFKDKIILVGLISSTGTTDLFPVPFANGQFMPGVEIQANAVESLLQNQHLYEQPRWQQATAIVLLALITSLLYCAAPWYTAIALGGVTFLLWALYASFAFSGRGEIVSLFYTGLAIWLPAMISIGFDINREIEKRRRSEFLRESIIEVSRQRLVLQRVVSHIVNDITRMIPHSSGMIWLSTFDEYNLRPFYSWPTRGQKPDADMEALIIPFLQRYACNTRRSQSLVAVPVNWRSQVIGVFMVRFPSNRPPDSSAIHLLEDFARQLAPSLENATLYTKVEQQRTLLEAILKGSPAGIIVIDQHHNIIISNNKLGRTLRREFLIYEGQNFLDLITSMHPDRQKVETLEQHLAAGAPFQDDIRIGDKIFNLDAAPLADHHQWVIIMSDITALWELNQLKTRMIRMASHDLKNPLARAMGYLEMLLLMLRDKLSDRDQEYAAAIDSANRDMLAIITDVLSLEEINAQRVEFVPVLLNQITQDVLLTFRHEFERKRLTVETQITDEAMMMGQERQLALMVANLISNAVKYTPEGGRVTVRVQQDERLVRMEVEDTGIGISEEAQKNLFSEFYRVRTPETRDIPGTGLGLSLVKSVVEAHRGRVWVKSAPGEGSTFYVNFPRRSENR